MTGRPRGTRQHHVGRFERRGGGGLVFEKVDSGRMPLSVFELITATSAADGFHLHDDWFGPRG